MTILILKFLNSAENIKSMGVPFMSWNKKLPRRSHSELGGRPSREMSSHCASLQADATNYASLIRANIYCEACKKCFTERNKLVEHRSRCPELRRKRSSNTTEVNSTPKRRKPSSKDRASSTNSSTRSNATTSSGYSSSPQSQQPTSYLSNSTNDNTSNSSRRGVIEVNSNDSFNLNFLFD